MGRLRAACGYGFSGEEEMSLRHSVIGGLAAAMWMPTVWAASDAELAQIRAEIKQMRETYEARIAALEQRLAEAEKPAAAPDKPATPAEAPEATQAATPGAPAVAAANAFNPAISLILSGTYANLSQDPNNYQITGFIPSGDEVGPPSRSFSLGESELALSANIDPYLRGEFTLALASDNSVSVENAYIQTLALPYGTTLRAGRFYSGIGYINEQHAHTWDFVDLPLAQNAFLGGQYADDGVQIGWLAPTNTYFELGGEIGSGHNFPGSDQDKNGIGGWSVFAHTGGDVGDSHSWLAGLSYLHDSPKDREFSDNDLTSAFTGTSRLWLADLVWKWAPNGDATRTSFKFQGEYYWLDQSGELTYDTGGAGLTSNFSSRQSGWYAQGVYQFMPRWRTGVRYDRLSYGSVDTGTIPLGDLPILQDYNPTRTSIMFDYSPSEFSRFRLQLARDKSHKDYPDNQIMLQYITSLGAHGAHRY
jgi:hypothetical protein